MIFVKQIDTTGYTPSSGNPSDLATVQYLDLALTGLLPKDPVRVASTVDIANLALPGTVIDGVTLADDDRVLLKDQSDGTENGIYIYTLASGLVRSSDFDGVSIDVNKGSFTMVQEGTASEGKLYFVGNSGTGALDIGTDSINFYEIGSFTLSDGSGTTANGMSVDLGGEMTQETFIWDSGAPGVKESFWIGTDDGRLTSDGNGEWQEQSNQIHAIGIFTSTFGAPIDGAEGSYAVIGCSDYISTPNNTSHSYLGVNDDSYRLVGITNDGSGAPDKRVSIVASIANSNLELTVLDTGAGNTMGYVMNAQSPLPLTALGDYEADYVDRSFVSKQYVDGEITSAALTIAAGSTQYLEISGGELSIKSLSVTDVVTDSTAEPDFATWYTNNFTTVDGASGPIEEGDILILTAIDSVTEVWMHNGGVAGTAADFTQIQIPNLSDSYVRGLFTGTNGITYTVGTGEFKLGGTLTEPTTITGGGAGNHITLETLGGGNTFFMSDSNIGMSWTNAAGSGLTFDTSSGFTIASISGAGLYVDSGGAETILQTSSTDIQIILDAGSGGDKIVIKDATDLKGVVYAADYSANFTIRSLVDKGYVDDAVLGALTIQVDDKGLSPASPITGDNQATGLTLTNTPRGLIIVSVNGQIIEIGDGTISTANACYFSADGGTTARALTAIVATDELIWNETGAGYDLATDDIIDFHYI